MDALECLKTRRCVRSYTSQPVPREMIEDIVDCGRLAATARNAQPWLFVAVTDAATRNQLAEISEYGKFIATTPCCIVVFCENGKYFLEDGSAATQNLLLAARAMGLGACWVAGDKKPYADDIHRLLNIPDTHTLISMVPVGYPESTPSPAKKPLDEVLRWERY